MSDTPTVRDLLVARAHDDGLGLRHGERTWTWREHVVESARRANWLLERRPTDGPFHVGLLGTNTADYSFWLGACALAGAVGVGLNPTRSDVELARDAKHAELAFLVADDAHLERAEGVAGGSVPVVGMADPATLDVLDATSADVPDVAVGPDDLFLLIFTSGTTSDPKAVRCSHGRLAHSGSMVGLMNGLGADDVLLVCMPLFHSNAVIAGWIAAASCGGGMVVRDFSASGFVEELRTGGITFANYVGKALSYVMATPALEGDADVPLRSVFGNEANEDDIHGFAARFGCKVTDAYGSTEGGINLLRTDDTPRGSLGVGIGDVRVLDEDGQECPRAVVDEHGTVTNLDDAVGELVNLDGPGGFEGYWNNPEADAERLRRGRFHSGDLAWRDADGFFWFAGRTGSWLRVDGENLAVAPIERVLVAHPDVIDAAVVAVPDERTGDQVLAWLEVADPDGFDLPAFDRWCQQRDDLAAKALPRFVRVVSSLPRTPSNKVVKSDLRRRGLVGEGPTWWRPPRATALEPLGSSQ